MADYIKRDALLEARELAICAYENAGVFNADAIRKRLKPLLDAVVDLAGESVALGEDGGVPCLFVELLHGAPELAGARLHQFLFINGLAPLQWRQYRRIIVFNDGQFNWLTG